MAYSPYAHTTATSGRPGVVRLGTGVGGNSDGTLVTTSVPNGVTTGGSYADPSWITSLAKSKVSLGNVENTALSTWAGSGNITTLGTVTSGSAPASDVYSWAKASTKPSYTNSEVGLGNVGNYTVNQSVGTGDSPTFVSVYAGAFYYTSDIKLKTNIENITGSWDIIDQLRPVSFDWKKNGKSDYGFIAQELETVLPNSVEHNGDTLNITNSAIIAHLVSVVKDLKLQVDELTTQLGK